MSTLKKQVAPYKVIVERDADGLFVASVPALPGCHTQAKTYPELQLRIREAIALCLDVATDDPGYRQRISELAYEPSFVGIDLVQL